MGNKSLTYTARVINIGVYNGFRGCSYFGRKQHSISAVAQQPPTVKVADTRKKKKRVPCTSADSSATHRISSRPCLGKEAQTQAQEDAVKLKKKNLNGTKTAEP